MHVRCSVHHRDHAWGSWDWFCWYLCWNEAIHAYHHQIIEWYSIFERMDHFYSLLTATKAFACIHFVFVRIGCHSTECSHTRLNEGYIITLMDLRKKNCWGLKYYIRPKEGRFDHRFEQMELTFGRMGTYDVHVDPPGNLDLTELNVIFSRKDLYSTECPHIRSNENTQCFKLWGFLFQA